MNKRLIDKGLLILSYLLSTVCIASILAINHGIATEYKQADGKTKALFGLMELRFTYQYYLLIPIASALFLGIICYGRRSDKHLSSIAIFFAGAVTILLISRIWRLML